MRQLVQGEGQHQQPEPARRRGELLDRFRLSASDTAVVTSWNTTKRIRVMCTRTVVPNHRPRLIGDQVRKSVMVSTRGRRSAPQDIAAVSLESNLTAIAVRSQRNPPGPQHRPQPARAHSRRPSLESDRTSC